MNHETIDQVRSGSSGKAWLLKNLVLLFVLFDVFASCRPHRDKEFLVTRIRSAAKLATTEVVLNKLVVSDLEQNRVLGVFKRTDKTVIFDSEARVKYGIRLDKLSNRDVQVWNDSIRILLPPVEIISFDYPHESYIQRWPLSDVDLIKADEDKFFQLDEVFRLAEKDIRFKMRLLGLKEEAELRTIVFLETFLQKIGYYNVNIAFREDDSIFRKDDVEEEKPDEGEGG